VSLRVASALLWLNALGFGLPGVLGIWSVSTGCGVPLVFGFPAYGGGPFEVQGIPTTIPLLASFLLICTLEGLAGWWLWRSHPRGAVLALVLLPVGAVFWWGFALPFPPLFALVRTVLILLNWRWSAEPSGVHGGT
jgi:hypothetical protein